MTSVYLYGELRNKFGEEFNFKINSPKEAFAAINANRRGFLDEIKKEALKGVLYRIVIDDKIIEDKIDLMVNVVPKEIHIVPVIWGAGKNSGGILMMAAGIALIAVTGGLASIGIAGMTAFTGTAATATTAAVAGSLSGIAGLVGSIGAALAIQGAMSLLFPQPKPDFHQEVQAGGKSYLFGGRENNVSQGQAVPVGYGRLLIGSSQISSSTNHYSLKQDMRALMTPTDEPIDDYMQLDFVEENQAPGTVRYDSFYTNQSSSFDDTPSFSSINILNSYINITTKGAETVISSPVEAVVKTNGIVVSNPDLTTFDDNVAFSWTDLAPESNQEKVKVENPFSFDAGLAYRVYTNGDFTVYNDYSSNVLQQHTTSAFKKYSQNELVRYGPAQFQNLRFQTWDAGVNYIVGELVVYNGLYYRAILAGTNQTPSTPSSTYWTQITSPSEEKIYRCINDNTTGVLPTDGTKWELKSAPTTLAEMNTLTDLFGAPIKDNVYVGPMLAVGPQTIDGGNTPVQNAITEFIGYVYIAKVPDREIDISLAQNGVMYEITKVGNTNWSSIGVAGSAALGTTFTKNSTTATGNGKVYPVVKYKFTIDCADSADLFIDGETAAYKYGTNTSSLPSDYPTSAQIDSIASAANPTVIKLTTGYHRIYARLYNHIGYSALSLFYQYDSNWDGTFSDWYVLPDTMLAHQKLNDIGVSRSVKFKTLNTNGGSTAAIPSMAIGRKYKIISLGDVNWSSIGASSPQVGSVFIKNSTTATGTISTAQVFSDTYSYAEVKAAESNRLVRFVAQRPRDVNSVNNAGAIYRATFQCKAEIGRVTLYSSPVKIYIKFLQSENSFIGVSSRTILPIETQQA